MIKPTYPPCLLTRCAPSSLPNVSNSPVKTNVRPARQLSAPVGISFDPCAAGAACCLCLKSLKLNFLPSSCGGGVGGRTVGTLSRIFCTTELSGSDAFFLAGVLAGVFFAVAFGLFAVLAALVGFSSNSSSESDDTTFRFLPVALVTGVLFFGLSSCGRRYDSDGERHAARSS